MTRGDLSHPRQSVHAAASHNGRVKMGDWNFLGGILDEVHIHSTIVGKIWLTILFIFRMLVLGVAAEDVWKDEQADFVCNTQQPGCRNVCYDLAFPISLIRYWVLQIIFVSAPSLVYMGHALYRLRALEKARQRKKALLRKELEMVVVEQAEPRKRIEREMKQLDQGKVNKVPLSGSLLGTYVAHIVTRSAIEVAFMAGQYLLYGFYLDPLFRCKRDPCPHSVNCYVSRSTEKSTFMVFMQCIAAISLFLNILEMMHLGYKSMKRAVLDACPHLREEKDELDDYCTNQYKKESVVQICTGAPGKATITSAPSDYNLMMEKVHSIVMYPNLIKPSTYLPLQGVKATQQDLDDCRRSPQSPSGRDCTLTTDESCLPCSDSLRNPKQGGKDILQLPPHSSERGSPDSSKCFTVHEDKGFEAESYGGAEASSGPPSANTLSKHQRQDSFPESLDDSSSGSRYKMRPLSSDRKTSMAGHTSRTRAPDLQI